MQSDNRNVGKQHNLKFPEKSGIKRSPLNSHQSRSNLDYLKGIPTPIDKPLNSSSLAITKTHKNNHNNQHGHSTLEVRKSNNSISVRRNSQSQAQHYGHEDLNQLPSVAHTVTMT